MSSSRSRTLPRPTRRTLAACLDDHAPNNFDLLRLLAALLVILSHSYVLTVEWPEGDRYFKYYEPFRALTGHDTLGVFAVRVFFIISGLLVARSFLSSADAADYVRKRLFRILPGLLASVLFCMLILGPLCTTLSLREYFSDTSTWTFLVNASMLPKLQFDLPGVFNHNYQFTVNGSLWSLPLECMMYLGLLLLGSLGLLRRWLMLLLASAALLFHLTLSNQLNFTSLPFGDALQAWVPNAIQFSWFFFTGAAMLLFKDRVPLDPRIFLACLATLLLTLPGLTPMPPRLHFALYALALPYLVICAGFARLPIPNLTPRIGDLSYGTYLYGWPVQQAILHFVGLISPVLLFVLAAPVTLVLAALSWHRLEQPLLRFKGAAPLRSPIAAAKPALALSSAQASTVP